MIATWANRANLRVIATCLLCLALPGCGTSGDTDEPDDLVDAPTDVSSDVVEALDSSTSDTTSADAPSDLEDRIDAERIDSSDTDATDSGECASECALGYNREHQCCDQLLREVLTDHSAPWVFGKLVGCPCTASNEMAADARCSYDYDLDLVCPKWTWQGYYNGDGPAGDAEVCDNRLDWIVENTRWISLEDVTDLDALREHVETLQPCPDPYGGEL